MFQNEDISVLLGAFVGSLLITGLISRLVGFVLVKSKVNYIAACILTFVICLLVVLALANLANVGISGLGIYLACQALWLVIDLGRRPKNVA